MVVIFWARCCVILFFKKKIRVALESRSLIWVPLLQAMTLNSIFNFYSYNEIPNKVGGFALRICHKLSSNGNIQKFRCVFIFWFKTIWTPRILSWEHGWLRMKWLLSSLVKYYYLKYFLMWCSVKVLIKIQMLFVFIYRPI